MERPGELGEFLRHCRLRVDPAGVGITIRGGRRLTGLRREEVSAMSGVGTTWYARLEQGRAGNVSVDVLDALARVLQLSPAEHQHLRSLGGHPPPLRGARAVPPSIDRLLTALEPAPAFAMDAQWNITAWNHAHSATLIDLHAVRVEDRNLLQIVFDNAGVRSLMADWQTEARTLVGEYRLDIAEHRSSPEHLERVRRLSAEHPDFSRWWDEHHVATFEPRVRHFSHPVHGAFALEHQRLQLASEPGVRVVAYLPVHVEDAAEDAAVVDTVEPVAVDAVTG